MNIIQKGNPNFLKKIKRFTCQCGCVFEVDRSEYTVGTQYNHEYYACKCPTCGSMIYIDD